MKKVLIVLIAAFVLLSLVACVSVQDFTRLYVGMPKEQVLSIFGKPSSTGFDQTTQTEYVVYYVPSTAFSDDMVDFRIDFKDNAVIGWGQIGHSAPARTNVIVYKNN
ncbi:MAG: outer membrane protein assembly factor BamE [Sphaerochaetaceae bacterium]|nr:outer membrane protein assembly factor BamE [Sphaerochaetaceae bacterium]